MRHGARGFFLDRISEWRLGAGCLIPKLVIVTEIIAPYRIPVFNVLAARREIRLACYVSRRERCQPAPVASV